MSISLPIVSSFDNKGVRAAETALKKFGSFAADIAKAGAAAVTAVAVAGLREATKFESSFARIQGLVGVSETEVRKLQEAARDLAPEFGKSANEAADALFFITSAGLRGADAVGVLEASLKASAAGLGNVNEIANAATAAMNTYGPSVLSGADAVDALTEAVRLGQFAPEELAGALGRVVPISAELGVSFQETTGLIAALTRGGLSASEAVTGVRGAMQAVLKPTQEASRMLEEYGFSTTDVRDSIERDGLLATFGKLRDAFGDNEEDFTRVIGSIEGLNAVLALTGENGGAASEIVNQMTDDLGVLDDAFASVEQTTEFKFNKAMANAKDVLLEIGGALADRLQPYLENFSDWIDDNGDEIAGAFDNIFSAVEDVAGAIGEFLGDLATDPEFNDFLDEMSSEFSAMWPEIQSVIDTLLDLAYLAIPAVTRVIRGSMPVIRDLVSIVDDLAFFTGEANAALSGLGFELPDWVDNISIIVKPLGMATDAINRAAEALNRARVAYEAFTGTSSAGGGAQRTQSRENARSTTAPPPTPARSPSSWRTSSIISALRAAGGPTIKDNAYIVGERGPELFVPNVSGNIIPNNRLQGGNATPVGNIINITVNAGMGTNGSEVGRQVVNAIKDYERLNGRVFQAA